MDVLAGFGVWCGGRLFFFFNFFYEGGVDGGWTLEGVLCLEVSLLAGGPGVDRVVD